jgi:hypothetical protein
MVIERLSAVPHNPPPRRRGLDTGEEVGPQEKAGECRTGRGDDRRRRARLTRVMGMLLEGGILRGSCAQRRDSDRTRLYTRKSLLSRLRYSPAPLHLTKTDTAGEVGNKLARMLWRPFNTLGCRLAILRQNDFASSIKTDDEPGCVGHVWRGEDVLQVKPSKSVDTIRGHSNTVGSESGCGGGRPGAPRARRADRAGSMATGTSSVQKTSIYAGIGKTVGRKRRSLSSQTVGANP